MVQQVKNTSELKLKVKCLKLVCHGAQALPSGSSIEITMIFKGCGLRNI